MAGRRSPSPSRRPRPRCGARRRIRCRRASGIARTSAIAEQILHNRFGYYTPGGGFFLWLDVGDGEEATRRLWREAHVKVLPGAYACRETDGINTAERYIRVALVHDEKTTREGLSRLAAVLWDGHGHHRRSPRSHSDDDPARRRARLPAPAPDGAGGRRRRRARRGDADVALHLQPGRSVAQPRDRQCAPHNLMGVPGAYVSDVLLQTFGLAIVLVPVALITWGVRMLRTHHLGFFGLRLSLLLLALLMMSVACVGLGDVGGAATHAGPGGLVGLALVGRFREFVLTHSSGGSLALIEPGCAALAFIAMAPALGMNRTDLPLIFRILRAPFLWSMWLVQAGVGLWRGRPQSFDEQNDLPAPEIGYAEIPGEIDASQYDPGPFRGQPLRADPDRGRAAAAARLADGRSALRADRAAGGRDSASARADAPGAPPVADGAAPIRSSSAPCSTAWPAASASSRSWAACVRRSAAAGRAVRQPSCVARAAADAANPRSTRRPTPAAEEGDDESLHARRAARRPPAAEGRPPAGVKIMPRKPAAAQGKRAAKAGQRELDLGDGEYRAAAARPPVAAVARRGRDQDRRGGAGAERAPARDGARGFRRQGPDREGAAGPRRDALRAGAGARHQGEPRHRPRRRHRPLDERRLGARRHRAGPQRDRHRAAQRTARDGVPARAVVDAALRGHARSACRWRWARTSAAIR